MTSAKRLAGYVHVGGQVYGPASDVPPEVAKQITNPKAWADGESAEPAPEKKTPAKKAASSKTEQ